MNINQLLPYDYISFDIFDTLIKRNTAKPKDVFEIVEKKYNRIHPERPINNFLNTRIEAERQVPRKTVKEDVTLNEIYQELIKIYTDQVLKELKEIELNTELQVCVPNKEMVTIYKECIKKGKNVIIISDMYLPKDIIESILQKNSIFGYEKLYVSSEYKLKKLTGNLYNYVLKDLNISNNQLIHIGDNKKSDFRRPKLMGIKAIHIPTHVNYLRYYKSNSLEEALEYRTISSFMNNHVNRMESDYWKTGYEVLGPLLFGFTKWLLEDLKRKEIRKVFFLSRDGYIIQKSFDIMNDTDIMGEYFYASRRSWVVPSLWIDPEIDSILEYSYLCKKITIRNFIEELGLRSGSYKSLLEANMLSLETVIDFRKPDEINKFKGFYSIIKSDVIENSKKEFQLLCDYMAQLDFNGEVAIVDIGWNGSLQKAIKKVAEASKIKVKIHGYYIGLNPQIKNTKDIIMKGYLFQTGEREGLRESQSLFESLIETVFTSDHGSVEKFTREKDNTVSPILKPHEHLLKNGQFVNEINLVKEIQRGSINFVNDFFNDEISTDVELTPESVFFNFLRLGIAPSKNDTELFGDVRYYNIDVNYLAKPRGLSHYILNPKELKSDFYNSNWRIGFLKRLFKIPLPYSHFYKLIKRMRN